MVAKSGDGWRLAPSLVALIDETDRRWPRRSRISDGSIGDTSHSSRTSDHNPSDGGWVAAVDVTEDHANGPDLHAFWAHIVATRDPRVKYLIYERRIVASYPTGGVAAWTPRAYTGVNAHEQHLHVSVLNTTTGLNSTVDWYGEGGEMPLDANDLKNVATAVRSVLDEGTVLGNRGWAETNRNHVEVSRATYNNTNMIRAALGGLTADDIAARIFAKFPAGGDVDQATVEAGVRAVLADALDG